jgi:hypothetical protein
MHGVDLLFTRGWYADPAMTPHEPESDAAPAPTDADALACARCRAVLSRGEYAIEVAGAHRHADLENPGGHRFTVACFARAPGCVASGETSDERAWFSGCTWQRAFCRDCTWHVGWLFRGRSLEFFGLDTARIAVS